MSESIRTLLDVQIGTKQEFEELDHKDDLLHLSISKMTIHLAKIVPTMATKSLLCSKLSVKAKAKVTEDLGLILKHLFLFCNVCNFDIPDEEEILDFEEDIPFEVQNDSILTLLGMLGGVSELAHYIYVDIEGFAWEQPKFEEEFELSVLTVIAGIKLLCDRNDIDLGDVIDESEN